jgi:hypothetical protein
MKYYRRLDGDVNNPGLGLVSTPSDPVLFTIE